jgi:hypothetical protein
VAFKIASITEVGCENLGDTTPSFGDDDQQAVVVLWGFSFGRNSEETSVAYRSAVYVTTVCLVVGWSRGRGHMRCFRLRGFYCCRFNHLQVAGLSWLCCWLVRFGCGSRRTCDISCGRLLLALLFGVLGHIPVADVDGGRATNGGCAALLPLSVGILGRCIGPVGV